jgi:predicted secreted hydrolase
MTKITAKFFFLTIVLFILFLIGGQLVIGDDKKGYLSVTGPCNLEFPRDHGPHPGYRTEWWYYTGNLKSKNGNRYGFQLTFFRSQISPPGSNRDWPKPTSAWRTQQIYLGHAAISDISAKRHIQAGIVSREALGMAGGDQDKGVTSIFIHRWSLRIESEQHILKVTADDFAIELTLTPTKPPVLHGDAGYSRKGSTFDRASCYYSFTRLRTKGSLSKAGETESVEGFSWMDREFSSEALEPGLSGWDWFSLQLSDNTETMIYLLRKNNGELSPASSGTFVDATGEVRALTKDDFRVEVLQTWKSPASHAVYPAKWQIQLFPQGIDVIIIPNLADQEMHTLKSTGLTYWEGSISLKGTKNGRPLMGQGYAELTGYARPFDAPM